MTIGERLDQLLKQHGLTQSAFAALVGMSQQGISKIKRGEVSEPKTILSIARGFGITANEFMEGVDSPRVSTETPPPIPKGSRKSRARWPFKFKFAHFDMLSDQDKAHIEFLVWGEILKIRERRPSRSKSVDRKQ